MDFSAYNHIFKDSDWPIKMKPIWGRYFFQGNVGDEDRKIKQQWVQHIISLLRSDGIYLAESGENDDKFRTQISRIIIHHTQSSAQKYGYSNEEYLEYINALHLIRLYAFYYSNPDFDEYGKSIYSGHYYNGKQIFVSYHWMIYEDGVAQQINKDESLVWHAASNNTDSIGVCFVGDFRDGSRPNTTQTQSAKKIIAKYRNQYPNLKIQGHREVKDATDCPGSSFLGTNGWVNELM